MTLDTDARALQADARPIDPPSTLAPPAPLLAMRGIAKRFPGVHALRDVDLTVHAGEILGLVGENGAGKSTLIKILSGAYQRDAGTISVDDVSIDDTVPQRMLAHGIAVIYQEPSLAVHLTVAENIFMGRLPTRRGVAIDWPQLDTQTAALSERLGLHLEPRARVADLSVARRQMVEIAKALSRDARIIVLDEPSAVLGDAELQGLFRVMRRLAEKGVGQVYISHRLNEVYQITDRVTVMKDGRVVATAPTRELGPDDLVRLMVGRDLGDIYDRQQMTAREPGPFALSVRGLTRKGVLKGVSFDVREGEILGIAGLAGSGRTEILRAVHGADQVDAARIEVHGREVRIRSPRDAIGLGIGLLTEDRKADGLMLLQSVAFNTTIARMADVEERGVLRPVRERSLVRGYIDRLSIRTPSADTRVRNLSGGNQQKVIFAKWLNAECRILLIDEPTRGVDVGAKREIYLLLRALADRGVAIVMVSSELPEVLGMSDRILVMRDGRVAAELARADASEERIMFHCTRQAA
jgi:ribose transport system ATP-binding protein